MRRGEIWLVHFDPTVGAEMGKTRPAVIVSKDSVGFLALKIIVPITKWQDRYTGREWMVPVEPNSENGLSTRSAADTFQVRSVSLERMVRRLGVLSEAQMQEITDALAFVMSIDS